MKKRVVKEEKKNVRGLLSVVRLKKERKGNGLVSGNGKKEATPTQVEKRARQIRVIRWFMFLF